MRSFVRHVGLAAIGLTVAVSAAVLVAPIANVGIAWAQQDAAPKQIKLTQPIVDHLIAAQKQIRTAEGSAPQDQNAAADPKLEAKMAGIIKSSGFASMSDFSDASYSVGMVLSGMDPEGGDYIGPQAALKKQLDEVKADAKMPPKEKKEATDELNEAMKSAGNDKPLPGNVDIVKANLAKLNEGQQGD